MVLRAFRPSDKELERLESQAGGEFSALESCSLGGGEGCSRHFFTVTTGCLNCLPAESKSGDDMVIAEIAQKIRRQ